jgi:hypothetical protein
MALRRRLPVAMMLSFDGAQMGYMVSRVISLIFAHRDAAQETLLKHRPVLMIEGANHSPKVVSILSALGFQFADFSPNGCA